MSIGGDSTRASGAYWLEYYQRSKERLASRQVRIPTCQHPGCTEQLYSHTDYKRLKYCAYHAHTAHRRAGSRRHAGNPPDKRCECGQPMRWCAKRCPDCAKEATKQKIKLWRKQNAERVRMQGREGARRWRAKRSGR